MATLQLPAIAPVGGAGVAATTLEARIPRRLTAFEPPEKSFERKVDPPQRLLQGVARDLCKFRPIHSDFFQLAALCNKIRPLSRHPPRIAALL